MSTFNIILIILLIFFIFRRFMPVKGVHHITGAELKKILKKRDIQFIDVRTPGEFSGRHIKEFKNIPLFNLKKEADKLDKNKEVVVICQSGNRSMQACRILKKHGFELVTNVSGGMMNWH